MKRRQHSLRPRTKPVGRTLFRFSSPTYRTCIIRKSWRLVDPSRAFILSSRPSSTRQFTLSRNLLRSGRVRIYRCPRIRFRRVFSSEYSRYSRLRFLVSRIRSNYYLPPTTTSALVNGFAFRVPVSWFFRVSVHGIWRGVQRGLTSNFTGCTAACRRFR